MPFGYRIIVLWFLLMYCEVVGATNFPAWHTNMQHKGWGRQDGAPLAVAITQDQKGSLWLASRDGLYRFDGVRFERMNTIEGHAPASPAIRTVESIGDTLWLGYVFGGVSVFKHGAVKHYTSADGAPDRSVDRIRQTPDGTLWLSGAGGVFWLDGEKWKNVTSADGLPAGRVESLEVLPDGSVLVSHKDGLYRNSLRSSKFRKVSAIHGTYATYPYRGGEMLIVGTGRVVHIFDPKTNQSRPLELPTAARDWLDVFPDKHGSTWAQTDRGLILMDVNLHVQKIFPLSQKLTGNTIFAQFDDREGNLWLATDNGIDRLREARINSIDLPPSTSLFPSVAADASGRVWIGSIPGTNRLPGSTVVIYPDNHRVTSSMRYVSTSTRAHDGSLWFAASDGIYHESANVEQHYPLPTELKGSEIQALAVDDKGGLWVSVPGTGMLYVKDGVWSPGGGFPELAKRPAVTLHFDRQGRLWFGYPKNQMAVLERGKVRQIENLHESKVGNIFSIISRSTTVWVGGDEGLAYFDGHRFRALRNRDGSSFHGISGLVETAKGELWVHDTDGLVRIPAVALSAALRAQTGTVSTERFDHLDGYVGSPPQLRPLPTLVEAADGRIWYANASNVGWIQPDDILRNTTLPVPQITGLRTDAKRYDAMNGITLPQGTENIQVDYTASSLSMPERVNFRFRLTGQDTAWREAGGRRQAFFTNLYPGEYKFELMVVNEDGLWSANSAELTFHIAPAFTQTIGFKITCGLLALALLYAMYRSRLRYATNRIAERAQERLLERQRIVRTLHDTFLQSVQALMMCFHRIKESLPQDSPAQDQIDIALDAADDVLIEGRNQLLYLRVRDEDRPEITDVLKAFGNKLMEHRNVALSCTVLGKPYRLKQVVYDEALTIGKEAMFNALRHSGAPVIQLELEYGRSHFKLYVRDQGKGIDSALLKDQESAGHWGLLGMRERADHIGGELYIDSRLGEGTDVSLRVPANCAYEE